jgi:hypothetical protein
LTKLDGRSILAKVDKLYESLINLYSMDADISHDDIEDLITGMFGYSDRQTYKRYFKTLERSFYLRPSPNAHPISPRSTVTKQKVKGGTLDHHIYRGEQHCWSSYRLGQVPLRPRARVSLQSSINEEVWNQEGSVDKKICARNSIAPINESSQNTLENPLISTDPMISTPQIQEIGEREKEKRE